MPTERTVAWLRNRYADLLRLYPRPYRERFRESMEQTFTDLWRDEREAGGGLFRFAVWMFFETSVGILKERWRFLLMRNANVVRLAVVVGLILLVPLVAMQFTDEVAWTAFDFAFAAALLFGTGFAYLLVTGKSRSIAYKAGVAIALLSGFLLIWVNGAVGIIGDEHNPANLLYGGVLAVGLIGAAVARLRPRGMSHTLFAMAVAQLLVPVIALVVWTASFSEPPGMLGVFVINACFALLLAGSALLFRLAAEQADLRNA